MGTWTARGLAGITMVAAIACGGGGSGGTTSPSNAVADSAFGAAVTGTFTDSLTGPALFDEVEDGNGNGVAFLLSFGLGTQTGTVIFARETSGIPADGDYPLFPDTSSANPAATQFFAIAVLGPTCTGCTATGAAYETSGTLSITSTSSTRIHGTFTFVGIEIPASDTSARDPITITGAFDAAAGPPVVESSSGSGGTSGCGITIKCSLDLPYSIVERTSAGDFASNAWIGWAGSVTGRAVKTRSQRAER